MIRWFRRKRPRPTADEVAFLHLVAMFEALPKPKVEIPTPPRQVNPKYTVYRRTF